MPHRRVVIDVSEQRARLMDGEKLIKIYPISTSANGVGCEFGSSKTPSGRLKIHKKIGSGEAIGTVFRSRIPSGEICTETPRSSLWQSREDLVLTRILWLEGLEPSNSNTLDRFVYLHGTNQEHLLGTPASHGCIRFSSQNIQELFELVEEGTEVVILG